MFWARELAFCSIFNLYGSVYENNDRSENVIFLTFTPNDPTSIRTSCKDEMRWKASYLVAKRALTYDYSSTRNHFKNFQLLFDSQLFIYLIAAFQLMTSFQHATAYPTHDRLSNSGLPFNLQQLFNSGLLFNLTAAVYLATGFYLIFTLEPLITSQTCKFRTLFTL